MEKTKVCLPKRERAARPATSPTVDPICKATTGFGVLALQKSSGLALSFPSSGYPAVAIGLQKGLSWMKQPATLNPW